MPDITPTKKRYFVIKVGAGYSSKDLFYFTDLDTALEVFKFLQKGEYITVDNKSVKTYVPKSEDKDGYTYKYYHFEDKRAGQFTLESKIIDIYTKKQIKEIAKYEEERIKKATKKGGKK
jgi:hypothetical protein